MISFFTACKDREAGQYIRSFWQTYGQPGYHSETILPKGVIELIFNFGDLVYIRTDVSTPTSAPRCFLSGLRNIPIHLEIPANQALFGIELEAAAVRKILKHPSGIFLNEITDLDLIDPEFKTLWLRLADAASFQERVACIQQWIKGKLTPLNERELAVSGFLHNSHVSSSSVTSLAADYCYSTRQLNRKSSEYFGMSTEALISYRRYIRSLQSIHHSSESLTRVGYDCQFYDQAHFIREFKAYTGLTPGDYRHRKSTLAGHLFH